MPRPDITQWAGQLFKRQLNAALDWLEANGGGGGSGGPPVHIGPDPPPDPETGQLWCDTDAPALHVGFSPPPSPQLNDMWVDLN